MDMLAANVDGFFIWPPSGAAGRVHASAARWAAAWRRDIAFELDGLM